MAHERNAVSKAGLRLVFLGVLAVTAARPLVGAGDPSGARPEGGPNLEQPLRSRTRESDPPEGA